MGSFTVQSSNSKVATQSAVFKQMESRKQNRTGADASGGKGAFGYSVVGINASKVGDVREVIRKYTQDILNHLEGIKDSYETSGAFRGQEAETAVKNYVSKVKEYAMNLVTYLNTFSDKLKDVSDAWDAYQASLGTQVNEQNSAYSTGTAYTEVK